MKKWWCIELLVSKYALDPSTATCRNRPTSVNWCSVLYTVASETGTLARFASSKSTSAVTCRSPLANRIQPSAMRWRVRRRPPARSLALTSCPEPPRTASERAMLRLSRTLLGSPLLGRPLLGRPLLGRPLLGQPLLGERGRRKSDWHWLFLDGLFLDGLFHHAPIARPSGGDCCGRN